MSKQLFTGAWWKAAAIRAGRTAILIALPYLGAVYFTQIPYLTIISAAALGFILSIGTSLLGLAEVSGATQPWWYATLERVVKTFAQAVVSGIGTTLLFQDVDWSTILQAAAIAAAGNLLYAIVANLPEAPNPVAQTLLPAKAPGDLNITAVPVIASVEVNSPVTNGITATDEDLPKHSAATTVSGDF